MTNGFFRKFFRAVPSCAVTTAPMATIRIVENRNQCFAMRLTRFMEGLPCLRCRADCPVRSGGCQGNTEASAALERTPRQRLRNLFLKTVDPRSGYNAAAQAEEIHEASSTFGFRHNRVDFNC